MTDQKITIDGEWAYAGDPFTQVKIVMVDRPGEHAYSVLSMHPDTGEYHDHKDYGTGADGHKYILVPLQTKPCSESFDRLIIDRTTENGGRWAFANDPFVEVDVIHIIETGVIVVLDAHGTPKLRNKYGKDKHGATSIVPLQTKPREWFLVERNPGAWQAHKTKLGAGNYFPRRKITRVVEVLDDD